ncbi:uncharacterized protein LOC112464390 isoform X2 [Temnothorax curvispinosus]|uniref:Uncharacterized protein LOC112464390 isoform X2 n=1 Tax=Temnothorax curvispinosus TaxID=300111 RepID=A0A6J1R1X9_9HYME|nr:uncharacterized protein LOC112464390 isoform X2 [Temnothorax curvispinosus]
MVTRKRDAPPLMKRENFLRATESAKVRQPAKEAIPGKRENGQLENLTEPLQMEFFRPTGKSTESSGNVKTPISPSSSRNKEKKVAEVQKPVVEERQEEAGSKYVKQKSRANSIQTKHSNYATYYRLEILMLEINCIVFR